MLVMVLISHTLGIKKRMLTKNIVHLADSTKNENNINKETE